MPLRFMPFPPLNVLTRLDSTGVNRHCNLRLREKIDGNRPILIELWPGEDWCADGEIRSQNSPSHNSINLGTLSTYYTSTCR